MLSNIGYMSVPQQETFRLSMIAMYFQNRRGACKHYYYVTSSGPKLLECSIQHPVRMSGRLFSIIYKPKYQFASPRCCHSGHMIEQRTQHAQHSLAWPILQVYRTLYQNINLSRYEVCDFHIKNCKYHNITIRGVNTIDNISRRPLLLVGCAH